MDKKLLVVLLAIGVLISFCAMPLYAGPVVTDKAKLAQDRALEALKAQEWIIYLTPEGGKGGTETDVITFTQEGKVSSRNLLAKGYGDTNFRISVESNGVTVWETMKVDKDMNLAFLRGEVVGNEMRGSIFMKSARGVPTGTYYYSTAAAPAAPAALSVATTTTTKKVKK